MDTHNPFVGLRPFESTDSLYYFGRHEQTLALVRQLFTTRFLVVVGSSGSGKSSLVRAGLIPMLEAGFLMQDRDRWHVATMTPGRQPLHNLARALLKVVARAKAAEPGAQPVAELDDAAVLTFVDQMRASGARAAIACVAPALQTDSNLLLLVDQFEEIFRFRDLHKEGDPDAAEMVNALFGLAAQTDVPVFVCLTMRSDYIGDCDRFHGLPEAINRSQYLVPRLTRAQRREAIEGPIRLSGAKISPRLLDRLLNENVNTRDDLPVLQHALMRTWDKWVSDGKHGEIDIKQYDDIKGVEGALSDHADEALKELSSEAQPIARRMFQALTAIDERGRRGRRPVRVSEVAAICETSPEVVRTVVARFRDDNRAFLVLSTTEVDKDPLIDISHESLIRKWDALETWVHEEGEAARIYRRLAESARGFGLYRDTDLQIALDWRAKWRPNAAWAARYDKDFKQATEFLDKSAKAVADEATKKRRRIRLGMAAGVLLGLAIVVGGLWSRANELQRRAEESQQQAVSSATTAVLASAYQSLAERTFTSATESGNVDEYKQAWLHALAALRMNDTVDGRAIGGSTDSYGLSFMFAERWSSPVTIAPSPVVALAISPDGAVMATGGADGNIRLWDVDTGEMRGRPLEGHLGDIYALAFSPDGKTLASGSSDNTIRLWQAQTGRPEGQPMEGHGDWVRSVAFSPDGTVLASGSDDTTVALWDVATRQQDGELLQEHSDYVRSVAFSPDGRLVASASDDGSVILWDMATRQMTKTLAEHTGYVYSVAFSPDGARLASASEDQTIVLWNVSTGEIEQRLRQDEPVHSISFSPDGAKLVATSVESSVRIWDLARAELAAPPIVGMTINAVAFGPDGTYFISGSNDGAVRFWDTATGIARQERDAHFGEVRSIAFDPQGKLIASGSADHTVRIWDAATGQVRAVLAGHTGRINGVAFDVSGRVLASASDDATVRLWDVSTGGYRDVVPAAGAVTSVAFSANDTLAFASDNTIVLWDVAAGAQRGAPLQGHQSPVRAVEFAAEGSRLASAERDGKILLWNLDARPPSSAALPNPSASNVNDLAFSGDGRHLAAVSEDGGVRLWDTESGFLVSVWNGAGGSLNGVTFQQDGTRLAYASADGRVRIWDIASEQSVVVFPVSVSSALSVAFSPDGKMLATGDRDNAVRLWDVPGLPGLVGHQGPVQSIAFSPDGATLASGSTDGTVRLWDLLNRSLVRELRGHTDHVSSVAFSPDGTTIASGSDDWTVRIWNAADAQLIRTLEGHEDYVRSVAFSPDGKVIASGSDDTTVRLWDVATGRQLGQPLSGHEDWVRSVAFSRNGMIASGSDDMTVRIWDFRTQESLGKALLGHGDWVNAVAFSPDGAKLASASDDTTVRLWDVSAHRLLSILRGHTDVVSSVAFSRDGAFVASGSADGTVRLHDLNTAAAIGYPARQPGPVRSVAVSPDGAILAAGVDDGTVRLTTLVSRYAWLSASGRPTQLLLELEELAVGLWNVRQSGLDFVLGAPINLRGRTTAQLLPPPHLGETRLQQAIDWAEAAANP